MFLLITNAVIVTGICDEIWVDINIYIKLYVAISFTAGSQEPIRTQDQSINNINIGVILLTKVLALIS